MSVDLDWIILDLVNKIYLVWRAYEYLGSRVMSTKSTASVKNAHLLRANITAANEFETSNNTLM